MRVIKWNWDSRPKSGIRIGKLGMAGYHVEIISYPPMNGYSEKPFLIAEVSPLRGEKVFRLHETKKEVKDTYSKFFNISVLNFGLCYEDQE